MSRVPAIRQHEREIPQLFQALRLLILRKRGE
jgi:hypothetical protein